MKHTKKIILATVIFFSMHLVKAQVSSPDTMVRKLFTTLTAKDEKAFVAMYPNASQMQTLIRAAMEASLGTDEMKQMMAQDPQTKNMNIDSMINAQMASLNKPEVVAQMQKSFGKSFQEMIKKGEQKGVNWSSAKLTNYTIDTTASAADKDDAMLANLGYTAMKGIMDFTSGDSAYQLSFEKVIYMPKEHGWFGGEFKQVIRKGESFAENNVAEDMMVTDSATAITETPKSKIKTKSSSSKTKVKTKTPARKSGTKS